MNIAMFCGSRSLALYGGSTSLACDDITWPLILSADLVVFGDARGPDLWAEQLARVLRIPTQRWQLDGRVIESERPHANRRWYGEEGPPVDRRRVPLFRNEMMVNNSALGVRFGEDNVLCVGFVDPASRTRGTDHTLRLARQAGIWCARYVWRGTEFVEES